MKRQASYFAFGVVLMVWVTSIMIFLTGDDTDTTDERLQQLGTQLDSLDQQVDKLLKFYHERDEEVLKVLTENQTKLESAVKQMPAGAEPAQAIEQVMESQQQLIKKIRKRVAEEPAETTGA